MPGQGQADEAVRTTLPRLRVDRGTVRAHAGTAALVVVLLVGAWFRLSGADWDEGAHLHPDERYIASVSNVIDFPWSPLTYLDVDESPLSPYNTHEGRAYPYGTLPLFATKAIAELVGRGDYDHLYLVGRWLGGLLDLGTAVLVFLIARALLRGLGPRRAFQGGVLAAALYALTVAAIQAAHFYTTDVWLVFFSTLALYLGFLAIRSSTWPRARQMGLLAAIGACLGFSVACKASGLFVAVLVVSALLGRAAVDAAATARVEAALRLARDGLLTVATAYVSYRLVSPYSFANSTWLDLRLSDAYDEALATQRDILDGRSIFAPTIQWLLSPRIVDPFQNLVVWQLGVALGLCTVAGVVVLGVDAVRQAAALRARVDGDAIEAFAMRAILFVYVLLVFLYMSTRFQHMGRYLLPIVPLLAVAASYGVFRAFSERPRALAAVAATVVSLTAAYALAFHAIYTERTTRLAASEWIAENVPSGARIASEHWDDSLPVGGLAAGYSLLTVPVFEPDDETKLRKLYDELSRADYYSLSSPRAWRTIGRLPDRYPLMVRFYEQLFAGRLGFREIASFSSKPRLAGVELDDLEAEEAFWVYDHPPVRVFEHRENLTFPEFRDALCAPPAPSAC
jgi:Dolichyl-phosphate-mannose-protein mannosyltransferase